MKERDPVPQLTPIPVRPTLKTRARVDFAKRLGYSESGFFNRLTESEEAQAWLEKEARARADELKQMLDAPVP